MPKHFELYEHTEWCSNGCSCCEAVELTYYNFKDDEVAKVVGSIPDCDSINVVLYEYLGYHIPEHLDHYNEQCDYAKTMLGALGVTWEIIKEENNNGI